MTKTRVIASLSLHVRGWRPRAGLAAAWCCWLLLAGCSLPTQASRYDLAGTFADPKAQQLALAAEQGKVEEVQRLMRQQGVNPDKLFGVDGMPLLAWPIYTHSPAGLKAMLEAGADPNVAMPYPHEERRRDTNYANAMVWATEQEDPTYLKLLLDHGGDPNTRNANDESLLFHAMIKRSSTKLTEWEITKLLVERGADVNAEAGMGSTIAENYSLRGGFELIYWLIQHGADPSVQYVREKKTSNPASYTISYIFWYPEHPQVRQWQRKCQLWVLEHGYRRPPLPNNLREKRKSLGYPYEEKDIPEVLPLLPKEGS